MQFKNSPTGLQNSPKYEMTRENKQTRDYLTRNHCRQWICARVLIGDPTLSFGGKKKELAK